MIWNDDHSPQMAPARMFEGLTPWRPEGRGLDEKVEALARLTAETFQSVESVRPEMENPNLPYAYSALWSLVDADLNSEDTPFEASGKLNLNSVYGRLFRPIAQDDSRTDRPAPGSDEAFVRDGDILESFRTLDEVSSISGALHNAIFTMHQRLRDEGLTFEEAREMVTWRLQWVVVEDFLKRICGTQVVEDTLTELSRSSDSVLSAGTGFDIPVEFSKGAFRLGFLLQRPEEWGDDDSHSWADALDEDSAGASKALLFDGTYVKGLDGLPVAKRFDCAAFFSLLAGWDCDLASGQRIAEAMEIAPLAGDDPLLIYLVREATELQSGRRLGPVGARIVAKTVLQSLLADQESYLNCADGWTPGLENGRIEYGLAEFLAECGECLQVEREQAALV